MNRKKLIPKHQKGKKILNWLGNQFIRFGNAQIAGESGSGTAMATASGYQHNPKTRMWEQSEENLKDAEGLRNNLSFISAFSPMHYGNVAFDATLKGISKLRKLYQLKKAFKIVNKPYNILNYIMPGQIGQGPKQIVTGYHASVSKDLVPNYWFEGWAQKTHNAPYGFYIAEGSGPKSGFLIKRPYVHQFDVALDKPFVQVGEVVTPHKNTTRNLIEKQAIDQGADGIIYQGIRDNQMDNQIITKTLHPDVQITNKTKINTPSKHFKNEYGREIISTPYQGPDLELVDAIHDTQKQVLRDYFSEQKINQIKQTMGWGDTEIAELQNEIINALGSRTNVTVKSPKEGFTKIASHSGTIVKNGSQTLGRHTVTLNREAIPDLQTAREAGLHELGTHGKTLQMRPKDFGTGKNSDITKEYFPRIAELVKKNQQIADDLLEFNKLGKFLNQFRSPSDLERYFVEKNLPWDRFEKFNNRIRYYRYMTTPEEIAARAYTGQLYEKVYGSGIKTKNIKQLEQIYTPESVDKLRKTILGIGSGVLLNNNE